MCGRRAQLSRTESAVVIFGPPDSANRTRGAGRIERYLLPVLDASCTPPIAQQSRCAPVSSIAGSVRHVLGGLDAGGASPRGLVVAGRSMVDSYPERHAMQADTPLGLHGRSWRGAWAGACAQGPDALVRRPPEGPNAPNVNSGALAGGTSSTCRNSCANREPALHPEGLGQQPRWRRRDGLNHSPPTADVSVSTNRPAASRTFIVTSTGLSR